MGGHDTDIQPLLQEDERDHNSRIDSSDEHIADDAVQPEEHEDDEDEDDQTTAGWFLMLLTGASGVSGLLFGYEYSNPHYIAHFRD